MESQLRTICEREGVILRHEAIDLGYDDRSLRRLVASGDWVRVRRGAYTDPELWREATDTGRHRILARAVSKAAAGPVVLSHLSAAIEHGADVWDLPMDAVHVTHPTPQAGRTRSDVRPHGGLLLPRDVESRDGVLLVPADRAALEVSTMADVEHALVVVDSLLHQGATTVEALVARADAMSHWPGSLTTDLVVRLADPKAGSPGESRVRHLCWSQSLPKPVTQWQVSDEYGELIAELDFAWPEYGGFVEFDGKAKYLTLLRPGETAADAIMREKARERLVLEITGWRILRLTWADLARPARTAAMIRRFLGIDRAPTVLV